MQINADNSTIARIAVIYAEAGYACIDADGGYVADGGLVAVGGIAVGVVGKGLWDAWLAVGKVRADREARLEARQDKRRDRRDDLQRQTLLELQDTMASLLRATSMGHNSDDMAARAGQPWGQLLWPDGVAEDARSNHMRLVLLRSRLRDDGLRQLAADLSPACVAAGSAKSRMEAEASIMRAMELCQQAQDLAGKLVREMDEF